MEAEDIENEGKEGGKERTFVRGARKSDWRWAGKPA